MSAREQAISIVNAMTEEELESFLFRHRMNNIEEVVPDEYERQAFAEFHEMKQKGIDESIFFEELASKLGININDLRS